MAEIETTGKGKKAHNRLRAVNSEVNNMIKMLHVVSTNMIGIFKEDKFLSDSGIELDTRPELLRVKHESPEPEFPKLRGMIVELPRRIEVICNDLRFYIDFALLDTEDKDTADLRGSIVYGTNRALCFQECIFPEVGECKRCQRIARCDGLEDKPLIQFTVDRYGILKSPSELDDEWRMKGDKENTQKKLREIHYRALDHIWKDALSWTNENILP